jgi:hypothetical protein
VHLIAGVRTRRTSQLLQHHAEQRNRGLLPGREQHIELTRRRLRVDALGQLDQPVGLATHGGHHDYQVMPLTAHTRDPFRDRQNPLRVRHRSAAVFLDNQ